MSESFGLRDATLEQLDLLRLLVNNILLLFVFDEDIFEVALQLLDELLVRVLGLAWAFDGVHSLSFLVLLLADR